jgi:hypothetical protein
MSWNRRYIVVRHAPGKAVLSGPKSTRSWSFPASNAPNINVVAQLACAFRTVNDPSPVRSKREPSQSPPAFNCGASLLVDLSDPAVRVEARSRQYELHADCFADTDAIGEARRFLCCNHIDVMPAARDVVANAPQRAFSSSVSRPRVRGEHPQTVNTILPICSELSMRRCASLASANGKVRWITGFTLP